jgi:pyridoxamine 5'-phosphate oxidase
MASTSSSAAPQPAPWKSKFLEHINKMDKPEFVFSSLHPAPDGSPTPYVPRARFCIFRGFWAELPENKHNPAEKNERVYETDLPTFTTDVRMQKPFELFASSSGHADSEKLVQGSGGGGPCEAVWWAKDVMVQWRMKGDAFVVAPDIEGEGEESSGVRTVKSEVGSRMRVVKEDAKDSWSWDRELTAQFGNMAPGMRGMF